MSDENGHISYQNVDILTTTFETNWYWYFESLFWPEQIMRINQICERKEEIEALTVGVDEEENANHKIRKNKVSFHDNEELYGMIRQPLANVNQHAGWNYNICAIEPLQYTIYYGDENHYEWHTDTIVHDGFMHPNAPDSPLKGTTRKITCVINLSHPHEYEGGDFQLMAKPHQSQEMEIINLPHFKDKGSAIFFPSFTYHRVTPVTKGIRKTLVCWFRGPKWV